MSDAHPPRPAAANERQVVEESGTILAIPIVMTYRQFADLVDRMVAAAHDGDQATVQALSMIDVCLDPDSYEQ